MQARRRNPDLLAGLGLSRRTSSDVQPLLRQWRPAGMLTMKTTPMSGVRERGVMLLEVLIALLIFAIGILGLVGLQANAVRQSGMAQYRADAVMLAGELVGQMSVVARDFPTLSAQFASVGSGPGYEAWKARVNAVLPGASGYPPLVVITEVPPLPALVGASAVPAVGLSSSSRVAITVRWRLPQDTGADPVRNHTMITEVRP